MEIKVNKQPEPASRQHVGETAAWYLSGRTQPPCWPVSGLAEHPPMPSQALVQGAQWRVDGERVEELVR